MTATLTLAGYLVIAAAVGLCELRARRNRTATFGHALAFVMQHRLARVLVCGGWLWLGWHLFVRFGDR